MADLSAPTIGSGRWVGVDAQRPGKIILPQIDGLRGVAICAVIFQHAFSHGISHALVAAGVIGFPYLVDDGWMGVSLFFILSGFVLSLPYTGAETKFYDPAEALAFYRRRARRLLPLFAMGCLVGCLANHATLGSLLLALTTLCVVAKLCGRRVVVQNRNEAIGVVVGGVARERYRFRGMVAIRIPGIVTTDDAPLPRMMDVPAIRDARIRLRIAELRVLAAKTAIEFWREQQQHGLASLRLQLLVRSAIRRRDGQLRP